MVMRALHDDSGGEILEYALVAGLVVVGAIGAVTCVGTKLLTKWNSINSAV
jgi:Flp pilus assembly pilin Flp